MSETVTDSVEWAEAQRAVVEACFPGSRLRGGISPSNSYVEVTLGIIQSEEEHQIDQEKLRKLAAAGGPVTWKWGV